MSHIWQIMDNLCDNAERHALTEAGRLELGITVGRADGHWRIRVCDNGHPIETTTRSALFEPFFTTHSRGTGLGLFVSRELALANHGELALDDPDRAPGRAGNCFVLTLPAANRDLAEDNPPEPGQAKEGQDG